MAKKQPDAAGGDKPEPKPKAKPPVDWAAVLRGGPDGTNKWNRQTAAARKLSALSGADLSGLDLSGMSWLGVTAKTALFANAVLANTKADGSFDGSDFTDADLRGVLWRGVKAPSAAFTNAKLVGADLRDANFKDTKLTGADLTGARLNGANLCGADLSGAVLADIVLDGAQYDKDTKFPDGFAAPPEMKWAGRGTDPRLSGKGKSAVAADINGLLARLNTVMDPKRVKRTLDMLKAGKNQLFAEIEPTFVRGIVRSQTAEDKIYSCVLIEDGVYACSTADLTECLGQQGEPCKHVLALVIGLARAGLLDPAKVDPWLVNAAGKNHRWIKLTKNHVSDTLLKYKGAQAGEIDWRPTETIPEDFYSV